jgi:peroxiredoxin
MNANVSTINRFHPPSTKPHSPLAGRRKIPGALIVRRELATISGQAVSLPDSERFVHLQFRRFAGCPICDLHLRSFVRRHREIEAAGIREIVVFHSPTEELKVHALDLPFSVIADPDKQLYAEFGAEHSVRSLLDPRVWWVIVLGVLFRLWEMIFARKLAPSLHITGGRLGLPADLLISTNGTVIASKYGVHAYDQWSVDELLGLIPWQKSLPSTWQNGREPKQHGVHPPREGGGLK